MATTVTVARSARVNAAMARRANGAGPSKVTDALHRMVIVAPVVIAAMAEPDGAASSGGGDAAQAKAGALNRSAA